MNKMCPPTNLVTAMFESVFIVVMNRHFFAIFYTLLSQQRWKRFLYVPLIKLRFSPYFSHFCI